MAVVVRAMHAYISNCVQAYFDEFTVLDQVVRS